ncbi:MAG: haloacid dehalogenase type II [Actinomycetota bacterium]|nr:haloacid dehalogenase type II [Actinomycetota bacterium]
MAVTSEPPSPPAPPDIIAFDVVGTLFSLESLGPLVAAAGGDASTVGLWFSHLLADGFALTAAHDYQPFREVARASLATVLPHATAAARDQVLAGLATLDPHPDSGPALGRAVLDARVVVITNSSTESTRKLLARGGLDAFVETIVSAEDVKRWKPASDPYAYAAATLDVPLARLGLVSVHPWDVMGARRSGLVTGWCNRRKATFPHTFGAADVTGATLLDVVENLFGLTGTG